METFCSTDITNIISSYENMQVQYKDEWYYLSYKTLLHIIKNPKCKLTIEKKRVRNWVVPFNQKEK